MREREEIESSDKDRPYLTKMMTSLLVCGSLGEKMPDRELVQPDCRAGYPGIRKDTKILLVVQNFNIALKKAV